MLELIAKRQPQLAAPGATPRRKFPDVPPGHLSYPAAALAVEAGVMTAAADGSFQLTRPVTGTEAVAAVDKLARTRRPPGPMNLTTANQLTILRMLLIPAFVILLLYGYRGWALITFLVAGLTDLLDGLIARARRGKDHARRLARSDGRQAAPGHDVHRADAAGHRLGEPAAAVVHDPGHQPRRRDRR